MNGEVYKLEKGDRIRILTEEDWPEDVGEGDLRERMGLSTEKSLEDQTSPTEVAQFFENTDEEGRGMVMFAVNSNQDNEFWSKVHDLIKKDGEESEE
jgi:hypothetical protein